MSKYLTRLVRLLRGFLALKTGKNHQFLWFPQFWLFEFLKIFIFFKILVKIYLFNFNFCTFSVHFFLFISPSVPHRPVVERKSDLRLTHGNWRQLPNVPFKSYNDVWSVRKYLLFIYYNIILVVSSFYFLCYFFRTPFSRPSWLWLLFWPSFFNVARRRAPKERLRQPRELQLRQPRRVKWLQFLVLLLQPNHLRPLKLRPRRKARQLPPNQRKLSPKWEVSNFKDLIYVRMFIVI